MERPPPQGAAFPNYLGLLYECYFSVTRNQFNLERTLSSPYNVNLANILTMLLVKRMDMARRKGFFENLFDISFNEFIAPKIVGILYLVILVIMGFAALAIIFAGFSRGAGAGLGAIIFAPLVFLAYLIFIRIGLEGFIATIKTAENTRIIAENSRKTGYQ